MNQLPKVLFAMGVFAALAGCEQKPTPEIEAVKTTEWYKENKAARADVLAKCNANPGELAATPNCVNASRADSSTTWGAKGGGIKAPVPLTADQIKKN